MHESLFSAEVALVRAYWNVRTISEAMRPATVARYERVFLAFCRFTSAHGITHLSTVNGHLCAAFVHAPRTGGMPPAASTSRFRLTVVRDAFRGLRQAHIVEFDPTMHLSVRQSPQGRTPVPLLPSEVIRLQSSCRTSPRDHLRPTIVELALAGGTHTEIASAVVADLDLGRPRVRLGSRWLDLDPLATATLAARVAACRRAARRSVQPWDAAVAALALRRPLETYPATSIAPSISSNLTRGMAAAGLSRPGLRPASLREFAANREYARTGRIEDVALLLGLDSLDVARKFIDPTWQRKYAERFAT